MVNQILKIKNFILTAFLIRSLLVIAEQLGILPPDGNLIFSDANRLELIARNFSKVEGLLVIENFLPTLY